MFHRAPFGGGRYSVVNSNYLIYYMSNIFYDAWFLDSIGLANFMNVGTIILTSCQIPNLWPKTIIVEELSKLNIIHLT